MKPIKQTLLFTVVLFLFACSQPYSVEEQQTAEILEILSRDELKGRYALSPEIKIAEDFIHQEFQKAGLTPLYDESFKQSFYIIESSIDSSEVHVAGNLIEEDLYFAFTVDNHVEITSNQSEVIHINEGSNFRSTFNKIRESESDAIVVIDPSFKDLFERYHAFYSREHRFLESKRKGNHIFVLSAYRGGEINVELHSRLLKKELTNVVGKIEGNRAEEFVVFSAHHDHLGIRTPVGADSIANGANDNGSGVTAIIQLAHHFAAQPKPERTLLFVTFTAEEMGGYGSQYFSELLNPDEIVAMFNIEMIGKPAVSGSNTAWITGYDRSTFGELLSESTEGSQYEFYPDPYPNQNLFYRSDNATLARLGVPAHSISTTPIDVDMDYHQVTDEFDTINISHLNNTIKAIAKAAEGIISGKKTPTRVDITQLD